MKVFRVVRGSVKQFALNGHVGQPQPSVIRLGSYKADGPNILVSNFQVTDNEKLGIIQCFNDTNHLYAFGHDPQSSAFSLTYIVFMGQACMRTGFKEGGKVKELVKLYNEGKVSASKKTVTMTFGNGTALQGVLLSLDVAVYDPEMNALTMTVSGRTLRWK